MRARDKRKKVAKRAKRKQAKQAAPPVDKTADAPTAAPTVPGDGGTGFQSEGERD